MRGYLPAALLSAKLVSGFVIGDLNACPDAIAECSAVDSQPSSVAASLECLQALQVDLSAFTPGPCLDALNLYYQASADDESPDSSLEIGQSDSNPRGRRPPRGFFIDGFFGESPRPNKYKFHPKADKEDEDDDDDDDDDDRKGRDKSRDGRDKSRDGRDKSRDGRDKSRGGRDKSRDRDEQSGKPLGDRDVKRGDRKDDSRDRGDEGRRERYDRDTDGDDDDARPAFRNGETRRRPPFPPRGPRPPFPPTGSFEDDGSFEGDDEARPRPPFPRFFEGADATRPRPPFPRDFAPRMPSDDSFFGPGSEANGETRPPRGPFGKRDHKAWDSDDAPEGFDKADKRDPRAIEWRFADPDQKPRGRKPDFFAFVSSQAPPKPFQFAPEPEPEMPALELIVEEAGYDYDYEYTEPAQPVEIASSDMN